MPLLVELLEFCPHPGEESFAVSCRLGSVTIVLLLELSCWRLGDPALRTSDW
jgi:hypothetical protein